MAEKNRFSLRVALRRKKRAHNMPHPQHYSPREKLQGCIWVFTIGDADDKPSIPHAHAKDAGYRLDAWTGYIYPAGNERDKTIGKLKRKELRKLHGDSDFILFARKQIKWYRLTYPHISFYVPEWFELKNRQLRLIAMNAEHNVNKFAFYGIAYINQ